MAGNSAVILLHHTFRQTPCLLFLRFIRQLHITIISINQTLRCDTILCFFVSPSLEGEEVVILGRDQVPSRGLGDGSRKMGKSVFWGFLHATSWIWGKRRQAKAGNHGHFLMANGGGCFFVYDVVCRAFSVLKSLLHTRTQYLASEGAERGRWELLGA